ncbi:ankyrin repeat domain-containing protein [Leisingera sp. NJS204]|uniref:ankyrin repeat domain-containing protein n=1 Tax=Leisingera sp. NJS204 TaxID=2508307 RepID=UPI00101296FB|nr:ankyrin repeat domain-containing protein [Leisingera sp. NJS204]QAX31066.1 hypothetical protein ETW24_17765 [Leisingera sp. NJS204]
MKTAPANNDRTLKEEPPDIFKAARDDDLYELRMALEDGQSLRTSQPTTALTPIHVAAMRGSVGFLKLAMEKDAGSSWLQDAQLRTPFDHAASRQDRQSMAYLHNAMYPTANLPIPDEQ